MGDFSANFHRPESGINTIEGNVAGVRAAALTKQREAQQAEYESRKQQIQSNSARERQDIHSKFDHNTNAASAAEQSFRAKTVGLVTSEEFKKAAAGQTEEERKRLAIIHATEKKRKVEQEERKKMAKKRKKKLKLKQQMMSTLSFANDDDATDLLASVVDDDDEKKKKQANGDGDGITDDVEKVRKDPTIDTSFLPDKDRESAIQATKKRLQEEWLEHQKLVQNEKLEITYSYWDGSGHRRTVVVTKGSTVGHFLELVRTDLHKEFREMSKVTADALVYVKEDLIIPHDITFYDLIATKARGKSGPLFSFDVRDDVRLGAIDVRVERDESHPGKVVERRWYDRNKHIFPASRWEVFDPEKDYGKYTIHGGEVNTKKKKSSKGGNGGGSGKK